MANALSENFDGDKEDSVTVEISSSEFVRQDVLVDPLMTDLKAIVVLEPARHLLRTQVKADQSFDQSPGRRINARFGSPLSSPSHAMGLLGPVASQSSIAPELATDRGFMSTNRVGNLSLLMTCFLKSVYLVSLSLGKLCVGSHTVPVLCRCQCSFFGLKLESLTLPQLTSYSNLQSCT